jgi:hypothetical protein
MFNLFKKKDPSVQVIDKIWMRQDDKWKACTDLAKAGGENVFIAWFDETLQHLAELFNTENVTSSNIVAAQQVNTHELQNKTLIFIEHYPLRSKEQTLFRALNLSEVQIFSALDEPLFKQFGGDKIIQMMKQLGMNETASIENSMISNAIRNAQEKIEKKLSFEQSARSQTDWLTKNFIP